MILWKLEQIFKVFLISFLWIHLLSFIENLLIMCVLKKTKIFTQFKRIKNTYGIETKTNASCIQVFFWFSLIQNNSPNLTIWCFFYLFANPNVTQNIFVICMFNQQYGQHLFTILQHWFYCKLCSTLSISLTLFT